MVHVEQDQTDRAAVLFRALTAAGELIREVAPIEHPGQAIGDGGLAQPRVEPRVVERREEADRQRLEQVTVTVPLAGGCPPREAEGAPQVALVAEGEAAPGP